MILIRTEQMNLVGDKSSERSCFGNGRVLQANTRASPTHHLPAKEKQPLQPMKELKLK